MQFLFWAWMRETRAASEGPKEECRGAEKDIKVSSLTNTRRVAAFSTKTRTQVTRVLLVSCAGANCDVSSPKTERDTLSFKD